PPREPEEGRRREHEREKKQLAARHRCRALRARLDHRTATGGEPEPEERRGKDDEGRLLDEHGQPEERVVIHHHGSRSARTACLPTLKFGVAGRSGTTVSPSGRLKLASSAPTNARSSASVGGSRASRGTTNAQPISPNTGSGTPTTATRAIFGWRASSASTS